VGRFAIAAVPLVLVSALALAQGGFHPDAWIWGGTLAAWAAAVGVAVTDRTGALGVVWRWPAAGAALLVWTLASTLWSADAQQSLLEARRTLVYVAVVLALVVLARRRASWTLVTATHVAITGVLVYALIRYLFGPRTKDTFEGYLLSQPLGYANAVGILAVMGMLLALGPIVEGRRVLLRAGAAATVPPLALALTLTGSNASWLALGLGLAATAILSQQPRRLVGAVALVAVASAPLVWLAYHSQFVDVASPRIGGHVLAAGAVAAAAVTAVLVTLVRPAAASPAAGEGRRRTVAALAVLLVLVAGAGVLASGRGTQPRRTYYHVAWNEYLAHPLLGSGAGTFARYWVTSGAPASFGGALDAHSLYLETLAELGPVGLLLLAAFLLYPLRRAIASRRSSGVAAAAGAAVAFLVHAGVDWDWELPAVVVAGIACLAAVMLGGQREDDVELTRPARVAVLAFAVALGLCAIAGAAGSVEPSASHRDEAPQHGASSDLI
jgi:hypothetical protein